MDLQGRMILEAERHAIDRARREGKPMFIYFKPEGAVYYVRTEEEGRPEGAVVLKIIHSVGAHEG